MNSVREIERLNARELELGGSGSWHDDYKDSAYVYVGGLPYQLTEGDVITIMSQFGEVVDISLPRDQSTAKSKGFAFVMYADQRSTVLAVDNLTGSKVLNRTLRVDHVKNYKQLERDEETGKMKQRDTQRMAAHPSLFVGKDVQGQDEDDAESDASSHPSIDPDDPMRDYLIEQRRAAKKQKKDKKHSGSKKHADETPEERRIRRERKKAKRLASDHKHDDDRKKSRDDRSSRRDRSPDTSRRRRDDDYDRRRDYRDRDHDNRDSRSKGGDRFAELERWAAQNAER